MHVKLERERELAVVVIDHPPVNALSAAVRQALWEMAGVLDADPSVGAVVLTAEGRNFIAGADTGEFDGPPRGPHLPDLIARIEEAQKPWIAAINGFALGGGLEICLGCSYRVATEGTQLGLPEVQLGLVPGAGGTARLIRLIDAEAAVSLVTSGRPISAAQAMTIGLVDRVVSEPLRERAIAFAREVLGRSMPIPVSLQPAATAPAEFWDAADKRISARSKGEIAPLRALQCLRVAATSPYEAAAKFERETFLELRASRQSKALRHVFFAERAALKPAGITGVTPRRIETAAVIGGGTMGAGIVAALLDAGIPAILMERDAPSLEKGLANVRKIYDSAVQRGRITVEVVATRTASLKGTTDDTALAAVDLVIEAVFEDIGVKRDVFAKLSGACRPDAILATNTSYLDPSQIAEAVSARERFIGLHFFSPANVMKLLEIVPVSSTTPAVIASAFALAKRLGKIPVRSGICDGFIGNRILKTAREQAERLLLSGATPTDVDASMRAFGQPMGPFEAQDLGGLDIAASQRVAARKRFDTPFAPIADQLCALARMGQKTNGGWYDYAPGERSPKPSPVVAKVIESERAVSQWPQRQWTESEIIDCMIAPMINEGARILDEKIAARAADIDLVQIHGYGFPRWRGGLMHYAETRGFQNIVDTLLSLSAQGMSQPPSEYLISAARMGRFGEG